MQKIIRTSLMLLLLVPTSMGSAAMIPFAFWNACQIPRATCLAHYNFGCKNDGVYPLLVSGDRINATCDMSTDGGGWTRLNTNLVTSSSPALDSADTISGNAVGQACGGTSNTFTVTGAKISYTKAKVVLTRTTTILQCANITEMTMTNVYYLNGTTWTSHVSNCDWDNPPWAKSDPDITTTTLAYPTWKLIHNGTATTFHLRLNCSYASDNGAFTAQVLVR